MSKIESVPRYHRTMAKFPISPSALFTGGIFWRRINAECHGRLVATVRKPVFYAWWNDHHIPRLHARPLSADFAGESSVNEKQHLVAAGMRLGLVATALPRAECHDRGLTPLRSLKNFEPFFRSVNVGAFHVNSIKDDCPLWFALWTAFACFNEVARARTGRITGNSYFFSRVATGHRSSRCASAMAS